MKNILRGLGWVTLLMTVVAIYNKLVPNYQLPDITLGYFCGLIVMHNLYDLKEKK